MVRTWKLEHSLQKLLVRENPLVKHYKTIKLTRALPSYLPYYLHDIQTFRLEGQGQYIWLRLISLIFLSNWSGLNYSEAFLYWASPGTAQDNGYVGFPFNYGFSVLYTQQIE
jgi:hypothetical protein